MGYNYIEFIELSEIIWIQIIWILTDLKKLSQALIDFWLILSNYFHNISEKCKAKEDKK